MLSEARSLRSLALNVFATSLCTVGLASSAWGEEYLSNLGNRFVDPANPTVPPENEIGDDQALISTYEPFAVQFFTGSGFVKWDNARIYSGSALPPATNFTTVTQFELGAVTFEFLGGHLQAWSNVNVQLFHQVGKESVLVADLGNPSVDPTPTEWPESVNPSFCTTYVDYHPLREILLQPFAEYWAVLTVADDVWPRFAALFSLSSKYVASTDWRMGETTTHDPWAAGEYLKFAVNAAPILGTNSTSVSTNSTGVAVSNVRLSASRVGSNIVLSWPTSTAPAQLYASPSFGSGPWSPVSSQPTIIGDNFVVTLPSFGSGSYFRLQAQ
jgi:hypothetical protein